MTGPDTAPRFGPAMLALLLLMGGGFFALFILLDRSGEPLHDRTRRHPEGTIQRELDATPLIMTKENLRPQQPTIPKPENPAPPSPQNSSTQPAK